MRNQKKKPIMRKIRTYTHPTVEKMLSCLLAVSTSLVPPHAGLGRRAVTLSALALPVLDHNQSSDPLATWVGFVPPPIEREVTYDELRALMDAHTITSVQPAVQHDYVVATTNQGHRLSCRFPEAQLPALALDSLDDGYAVKMLPRDETKEAIRSLAEFWLSVWIGRKLVVVDR